MRLIKLFESYNITKKKRLKMRSLTPRLFRENVPAVRAPSTSRVRGLPLKRLSPAPAGSGILSKCDKLKTPDSARVQNLRKTTEFSDKNQIDEYIKLQIKKAEEDIAANVIQKHWRASQQRKRNRVVKEPVKMINLSVKYNFAHPIIINWHQTTVDLKQMRKTPTAYASYQMRRRFGPLFWTFQVLKRLNIQKNHPKFYNYECSKYFIFEWNIFNANTKHQLKMQKNSEIFSHTHLISRALAALNNYMVQQRNSHVTISPFKLNKNLLLPCVRALRENGRLSSFSKTKTRRIMSHWYSIMDRGQIRRGTLLLYTMRKTLFILSKCFKAWREGALYYSVKNCLIISNVWRNKSLLMPMLLHLRGEFIESTMARAFFIWRQSIECSRKARCYAAFAAFESRRTTLKRFLFEAFKINAGIKTHKIFTPFKLQAAPQPGPGRRRRVSVFRISDVEADKNFKIKAPTSNIIDAVRNRISLAEPVRSLTFLERHHLRNVLWHLILLYGWRDIAADSRPPQMTVERFFREKMKRRPAKVAKFLKNAEKAGLSEAAALRKRKPRDRAAILKHEAHENALKWSSLDPRFRVSISKESTPFALIMSDDIIVDDTEIHRSSEAEHPPLLVDLKEAITAYRDDQRKHRRAPGDVFPELKTTFSLRKKEREELKSSSHANLIESPISFNEPKKKLFILAELNDLL